MYNYLVPQVQTNKQRDQKWHILLQETIAADFPQVNHAYDGRPYQWAYIVVHPFAADNRILKVRLASDYIIISRNVHITWNIGELRSTHFAQTWGKDTSRKNMK